MAAKLKKVKEVAKAVAKKEDGTAYHVRKLTQLVKAVLNKTVGEEEVKNIEKELGIDINEDGRIGNTRIALLVTVLCTCVVAGVVYAGTRVLKDYPDATEVDAITLSCDDDGTGGDIDLHGGELSDATIKSDTITEDTSGAGVTVEGVKMIDNEIDNGETAGSSMWAGAPMVAEPHLAYIYFEDWLFGAGYTPDAGVTNFGKFSEEADSSEWLVTVTDGGGDGDEAIDILDDAPGGVVAITTTDAAADSVEVQKNGESFDPSEKLWFEGDVELVRPESNNFFFGLSVASTDIFGTEPGDYIGFRNTTTSLLWVATKDTVGVTNATGISLSTNVSGTVGTYAKRLGFSLTPATTSATFWVDGVNVFTTNGASCINNNEAMSPLFGIETVAAVDGVLRCDYIVGKGDK